MKLIGNNNKIEQIENAAKASKVENRPVPHMLFAGAAGCGKTSMAMEVAKSSGTDFLKILPNSLKTMDDVMDLMDKLCCEGYNIEGDRIEGEHIRPSVIFIDEIHNLSLKAEEWLGLAMESFELEEGDGKVLWIPHFTLIGATTDDGKLSKPFRDRFKLRLIFAPYSYEESVDIALVHAARLNVSLSMEAAEEIAKRGRGVPRIIVGLVERVRDIALTRGINIVSKEIAEYTFNSLGIDSEGLTETELKILGRLYDADEPIGLENLSIIVNEAPKTILQSVEPFLIQKGLLIRTGSGRKITQNGKRYLEESKYISSSKKRRYLKSGHIRR